MTSYSIYNSLLFKSRIEHQLWKKAFLYLNDIPFAIDKILLYWTQHLYENYTYCIAGNIGGCLYLAILAVWVDCAKSKHRNSSAIIIIISTVRSIRCSCAIKIRRMRNGRLTIN